MSKIYLQNVIIYTMGRCEYNDNEDARSATGSMKCSVSE